MKKARRAPALRDGLLGWLRARHKMRIELLDVNPERVVFLALDTGLSAYDASYLWLARDLGAELVTLDKKLARAAAAS